MRKNLKSLRDARHLEKYSFTLSHPLFYEPFETHYKPSTEFQTLVQDLLKEVGDGWMLTRDGYWFHTYPKQITWPVQGWKVHVSATFSNSASILQRAARIALANGVPFKFALDKNILGIMGLKRWQRGGSGKFITMYPADLTRFKTLLEQLYAELREEEGPYILSDRRYKDCCVLYYRYGGMARTSRLEMTGEKTLVLISPDGEAIPDIRTPYFSPPAWAADPFPKHGPKPQVIALNGGKYRIKNALAFSNSGGVYLAEDRDTGLEVVVKEARAHTVADGLGNDAIKRLKKEYEILGLLQSSGIAPKPLNLFSEWENWFLVEEYIDGVDLRKFILTQSPLLKVRPSLDESREYYELFTKILRSFARAMSLLHERGIVFGDMSPNNIKIDPSTYTVRLIDFESAMRVGADSPTFLFTPGFKSVASIREIGQTVADDCYGLAAIMLYMIFPIAALSSLRNDFFDSLLPVLLADIGWIESEVLNIIKGLAKNEITCGRACELLDSPAQIQRPSYREAPEVDADFCAGMARELGNFILANISPGRPDILFPADPFIHQTNPLSLGFGACGVLCSLKKCGFEIPKAAYSWLEEKLDKTKPEDLPPGILTGAAGIAWSLGELGLEDRASNLMKVANDNALLRRHHSYLYGMAGVGMANLYLYVRTKQRSYLAMANEIAESLLRSAQENNRGIYWESDELVHLGYGYGQSGVALFLLRLSQLSPSDPMRSKGRQALAFDLSYGLVGESGVMSFPHTTSEPTALPYLEEGCAGIAKVAMRYGVWDQMDMMLSEVHRKYSAFPGLFFGLSSFVDVLTDAFLFSNDAHFLEMAKRPISGIRDIYLLKQQNGWATPGDGLFRVSCDYATGVAGVMRAFHRYSHLDEADFMLDEITSVAANQGETPSVELSHVS